MTFRLSSILISHFILNLHQVNRDLAHHSNASISLNIQLVIQTGSGRSLPYSLEPFAQPVHVDIEEEEILEDVSAMRMDTRRD